ncbi:hypothetical protein ACFQYP_22245 [Nonomuraea antimicrobica]
MAQEPASAALRRPPRARPPGGGAFDQVLSTLALRRCWSAVEQMPPMRQRVAFLRWNEQWTTREIADWLGVAPEQCAGTSRSREINWSNR